MGGHRVNGELGVVAVTGGSSGLGDAVVHAVLQVGGSPVVIDIKRPRVDVDFELVDLADGRAAEAVVRRIGERYGRLDGLVTAAGVDECGPLASVDPMAWERVVAVNLLGTAAVTRAAIPYLELTANGHIVTIASTLGIRAARDATAYCASKFGVVGFTRALAAELSGRVGVTLIVPGGMDTNFFDGRSEKYRPPSDMKLNDPANVAVCVVFALRQPHGSEVREMIVTPSVDPSYP